MSTLMTKSRQISYRRDHGTKSSYSRGPKPPALQKVAVKHSAIKGAKAIFQVNVIIFPAIGSYVIKILSVPDILKLSHFTRVRKI